MGDYTQARCALQCFSIVINSSAVKTASLLHVSDTFPFPLVYPEPQAAHDPPPPLQPSSPEPGPPPELGPPPGPPLEPAHSPQASPTPPLPPHFSGPLNSWAWEELLRTHPDRLYAQTLVDIIRHGVRIGYEGPDQFIISQNLASANDDPATLTADLITQNTHNRLKSIIPDPSQRFICSPLGLVPKSDGGWRRIHHPSFPPGSSVNDFIPTEWGALEYISFDEAIALVAASRQGSTLIKRDLADAFRHIPVAPQDHWLLGFFWNEQYWLDCFLPFGLRTSPYLFDLFAKGI